ncbi:MAG: TraR/DksA C4-type zinc finger protein [Desulfurivibrionaceae bacterium]|nr:TraR/DksA C4-type zinc finger protein [Desulfurivibrionaceae bacterium]
MDEKEVAHLKDLLLRRRREMIDRLQGIETDWQALTTRDIEKEEEAQKADIYSLFDRFEEQESQELADIEAAFAKMAFGDYGICEKCREPIGRQRLELLPATHFCRKCAENLEEKLQVPPALPPTV